MKPANTPLTHEQVELLMPAFVHGRLDSRRHRLVQEHIASCAPCAGRHREDLELSAEVSRPPPAVELLLTSASRERNRRRLWEAIDADTVSPLPQSAPLRQVARRRPSPLRPFGIAAGLAFVLLAGATLLRDTLPGTTYSPVTYQTRTSSSGAAVPGQQRYHVMFRDSATAADIRRMLQAFDAVVIDGPSAAGVYTLVFGHDAPPADALLQQLRQQPEIALAEPGLHGD